MDLVVHEPIPIGNGMAVASVSRETSDEALIAARDCRILYTVLPEAFAAHASEYVSHVWKDASVVGQGVLCWECGVSEDDPGATEPCPGYSWKLGGAA